MRAGAVRLCMVFQASWRAWVLYDGLDAWGP